jgi:protein YIPF6
MWGGSFVVTINTKLLGGHISFFQCVCVLGYCIFPVVLAAAIIYVLKILTMNLLILKLVIAGLAVVWSTLSNK